METKQQNNMSVSNINIGDTLKVFCLDGVDRIVEVINYDEKNRVYVGKCIVYNQPMYFTKNTIKEKYNVSSSLTQNQQQQ